MTPEHNGRVTVGKTSAGRSPTAEELAEREPEASSYERTLTDAELVGLALDVQRRTAALLAQGVPLPMQEIENHHIIGLLECFIGPDQALTVREWHLTWLDRMLDKADAAIRMQVLGILGDQPGNAAETQRLLSGQ